MWYLQLAACGSALFVCVYACEQHKLAKFLRAVKSQPGYSATTSHCVYGNDADQILLALASHEPRCSVLKPNPWTDSRAEYHLLHCSALREHIAIDMRRGHARDDPVDATKDGSPCNGDRAIDDFILLTLLLGAPRCISNTPAPAGAFDSPPPTLFGRQRLHPTPGSTSAVPSVAERVHRRHELAAACVPEHLVHLGWRVPHYQRRARRESPG